MSDRPDTVPVLPDFLTVAEVADRLRLSRKAVRAMIERRELPASKVGGGRGRYLVTVEALADYLAGCELGPAPRPPMPDVATGVGARPGKPSIRSMMAGLDGGRDEA